MLSDRDGRRLAQMEASLRDEDPRFVRRFDASWRPPRRPISPELFFSVVAVVVLALLVATVAVVVPALALVLFCLWQSRPVSRRRR